MTELPKYILKLRLYKPQISCCGKPEYVCIDKNEISALRESHNDCKYTEIYLRNSSVSFLVEKRLEELEGLVYGG